MPAKLKFNVADLLPLIQHTEAATEHRATYGGKPEPGLWLVKDTGVYLMSSSTQTLPGTSTKNAVVYAKGFDPDKDEDVWEKSMDAMGGDDGADCLPIAGFRQAVDAKAKTITINVSKTRLSMSFMPGK